MFNGIPMAPPVQAPQAGINVPAMDQVGMGFQMLPSLVKLLMGKQEQQQNGATATATPTAQNPQTPSQPQFQAPNYAGTGYQGKGALPPFGPFGPIGPSGGPLSALIAQLGPPGTAAAGLGMPGNPMMQRPPNPFAALNANPYAAGVANGYANGNGYGSGLLGNFMNQGGQT